MLTTVDDDPVRKVLGWAAAITTVLLCLGLQAGLAFFGAWLDEQNLPEPAWLKWVVWPGIAAITIMTVALLGYALFGSKGRAVRAEHRQRMRRLKNFELDGE